MIEFKVFITFLFLIEFLSMITFTFLDYSIIAMIFIVLLAIGLYVSRSAGESSTNFFLSGKNMPWWLLGVSMVATTFSTDTPNLVTDIVRTNGVSGNWVWWVFLLTGMLTVFVYAKLWRISGVNTDLEFYEMRYGGKPARFLRVFRVLYLGVIFNLITMAGVTLAAIKIGSILLGLSPLHTVLMAGSVALFFSTIGGFKGVIYTDFILFFVAMIGSIAAAFYLVQLDQVGGLKALLNHPGVQSKLSLFPEKTNTNAWVTLIIIPLAVQWWSSWYPGAEPGGGGYIAQRMLASKNANHAIGATFFFNVMHYALRPWPWILVALASLVVFPDLESIQAAFPSISSDKLGHDLAYPAMLSLLPSGLLGLVVASLAAAYMSTISTQVNWGASYLINDFYVVVFEKEIDERKRVWWGRVATIILMFLSGALALILQNALQLFELLLVFGAGTGLIFILRWFWWRINAWSEIAAMLSSGFFALLLKLSPLGSFLFDSQTGFFPDWMQYPFVVFVTTSVWLTVTYLTPPEDKIVLEKFVTKINPGGPGWASFSANNGSKWEVPKGLFAMFLGCVFVYSILFATGYFIYGDTFFALIASGLALISGMILLRIKSTIVIND